MRNIENIKLQRRPINIGFFELMTGMEGAFFEFPLEKQGCTLCAGMKANDWEHVALDLDNIQRCPTYEEMCTLKEFFFRKDELTLQIHPKQSEYVNECPFRLHLWRNRSITHTAEKRLMKKIGNMYEEAKKYFSGERKEIFLEDSRVLIIFCGDSWLSWEEICQIKKRYWQPEEAAVQFNISKTFDLNAEHIMILWDAEDFILPPKEIV